MLEAEVGGLYTAPDDGPRFDAILLGGAGDVLKLEEVFESPEF